MFNSEGVKHVKVIIPMAGKGTRLRPHTHSKAKHMVHVAGKPVLGHILDRLKGLDIEEIIFLVGDFADQTKQYVEENYDFKTRFITQEEKLGTAHAVHLAQPYVTGDVLILFVDTIFETDLSFLKSFTDDGVIWVQEVDDPRRFGVVVEKQGYITELVEKAEKPVSHKAMIGLYYLKDSKSLFACNQELFDKKIMTKGEYYLTDTFRLMVQQGKKLVAKPVERWLDCGVPETVLATNQYLLDKHTEHKAEPVNSVIIDPVYIETGAKVQDAIIGPHVSIGKDAIIKQSIIRNSIIDERAVIVHAKLRDSLIGQHAVVKDAPKQLNVGDHSSIVFRATSMDEDA